MSDASSRLVRHLTFNHALLAGLALAATAFALPVNAAIMVTSTGAPTASTCTLAQAINAANAANGITALAAGSSTPAGNCSGGVPGGNAISFSGSPTIILTAIDNYWYGPNALPPIASAISIGPTGAGTTSATIVASHVGDPQPTTANAFRFFYVSGGFGLPAGSLTLANVTLRGGYAKGGDTGNGGGGGGAGMGGAIFNQGDLQLENAALIGNTANGGNASFAANAGGGMGQDSTSQRAGGFGGAVGVYGGAGSTGGRGGGGGGGFIAGSEGTRGTGPNGGAAGGLGGFGYRGPDSIYTPLNAAGSPGIGGAGGDGGGGGAGFDGNLLITLGGAGGAFGEGGVSRDAGGGGGVGGGGGSSGIAGGAGGSGGFGGGGGAGSAPGTGGFGGGRGGYGGGTTAGAGMGGAIFNHTGTVHLVNVTASGNSAIGGSRVPTGGSGSGIGSVLFNLNGIVTIDFSTIAGNQVRNSNQLESPGDASIYSMSYGNDILSGAATSATLKIHNSIVVGTRSDAKENDVAVIRVNGLTANASGLIYSGNNLVGSTYRSYGTTQTGNAPLVADALLGSLSFYAVPVLPFASTSPARDGASGCILADGVTVLATDARGAARPNGAVCDIGAYEFDGDHLFANGFELSVGGD